MDFLKCLILFIKNYLNYNIKIMNNFLEHLSEYANLSDEQIKERASTGYAIDIPEYFSILIERDLCKSVINNIIERLQCIK